MYNNLIKTFLDNDHYIFSRESGWRTIVTYNNKICNNKNIKSAIQHRTSKSEGTFTFSKLPTEEVLREIAGDDEVSVRKREIAREREGTPVERIKDQRRKDNIKPQEGCLKKKKSGSRGEVSDEDGPTSSSLQKVIDSIIYNLPIGSWETSVVSTTHLDTDGPLRGNRSKDG